MDDLERWTKVLPLGTGGFGEVHLAWDTGSGEWVALKRFTGQDELGLLRFVIESRIRVSHPHLVRTLAFRLVDDRAWLVTQLARGGSVRGLMSRTGALPWGWVAEAVDQVLSALAALHSTGVIHRDLKPANLLLRDGGTVRPHLLVGDFGIATWRTVSMTGIGAAIGTPGYLAPEYLDGRQPAPATDVFAVGVLAAELLTGRRLVHYSNATPALPSSWSRELPLPPTVPAPLAAVLRRMADPDPRHRYTDCTEAREALLTAAPPESRPDLTSVTAPDILTALPPGWTVNGQEPSDETATMGPGWHALPIDGGPTGHVSRPGQLAAGQRLASAAPQADQAPRALMSPPHGVPVAQPGGAAYLPPADESAPSADAHPGTPPDGSALAPQTNGHTPPSGSVIPTSASQPGPREKRRKLKRAVVLVAFLLVAASAGAVWWTTTHRVISGQPASTGGVPEEERSDWVPVLVEPCSKAERGSTREGANGTERCQRTQNTDPLQHWVEEPEDGFPRSNPSGPFTGEACANDGDTEYTPVGDHLRCTDGTWRIVA